jgi:hypothetical protein
MSRFVAGLILFVGAWCVPSPGLAEVRTGDPAAGPAPDPSSVLAVVNSRHGTLRVHDGSGLLTLTGVSPRPVWFSDRPQRAAGTYSVQEFTDVFFRDQQPPNAALAVFGSSALFVDSAVGDTTLPCRIPLYNGYVPTLLGVSCSDAVVVSGMTDIPNNCATAQYFEIPNFGAWLCQGSVDTSVFWNASPDNPRFPDARFTMYSCSQNPPQQPVISITPAWPADCRGRRSSR